MVNVHQLPPDVIAKIAAGEVIERPASVVKELMENAIDAGASSIEVFLKDAGKELIHIKDNGHGISRDNIDKLFHRHATSKIKGIDDLETLSSLGFRGEALFSIAAIADVTLVSQARNSHEAWKAHVRGGKKTKTEPAPPSGQGTDIKVAELFFNTPARKKFLKSSVSEMNAILDVFIPYSLLYPTIRFKLIHNNKTILDLAPAADFITRAAATLNLESKHILETTQEIKDEMISLHLVMGNINIQRTRRDLQYFFVNNRPIQHRNLGFHLNDIYRLILPPSTYPFFIVMLTVDPSNLDVNIHPAKREVKMKDEARIISLLRHLVEHTLMTRGDVRTIGQEQASYSPTTTPLSEGIPADKIIFGPGRDQGVFDPAGLFAKQGHKDTGTQRHSETAPGMSQGITDAHLFQSAGETMREKFGRARYIGSLMNKYLLWESADAMLVVDQHAAQERIMFERFKNQIDTRTVEVQNLLAPILLKLTPQEKIAWDETQEALRNIGMDTTAFDDNTIAIQTVPVLIKKPEAAARALLGGDRIDRCDPATIARRACKASITAGDKLNPLQVEHQRQELLACRDPFICPHGRPTVIEMKDAFLERQFLRT